MKKIIEKSKNIFKDYINSVRWTPFIIIYLVVLVIQLIDIVKIYSLFSFESFKTFSLLTSFFFFLSLIIWFKKYDNKKTQIEENKRNAIRAIELEKTRQKEWNDVLDEFRKTDEYRMSRGLLLYPIFYEFITKNYTSPKKLNR